MPFTTKDRAYAFTGTVWDPVPAVYGIMDPHWQMVYIGQTNDLRRRMAEHVADSTHCMHQHGPTFVWAEVNLSGEEVRRQRELKLIAEYRPVCNEPA